MASRKYKKKNNALKLRILLVLLVVLAVGVSVLVIRFLPSRERMDLNEYFGPASDEDALVILGTGIQEQRGLLRGEDAYLPLDLVNTALNPAFYWDAENRQILYADSVQVTRTDASDAPGSQVIESGDTVYLHTDLVRSRTDLDVLVGRNPSRIAIQNQFTGLNVVQAVKSTCLRVKPDIKADILTDVAAGDYLRLENEQEDWYQVSSIDGFSGFVQKRAVSAPTQMDIPRTFVKDTVSFLSLGRPVNLVWDIYDTVEALTQIDSYALPAGLNVVSPQWFSLMDNEGNISANGATKEYVDQAHARGLQVWGLLDNFSSEISSFEIFSHTASRQHVIDGLMSQAQTLGLDGLNIDIEAIAPETMPHVLEFLRELSIETHRNGIILSFDDPVPEFYNAYYNLEEQGRVLDYVILMGYDEHYSGSEEAGSVASLPWVEGGVTETLRQVPADRVVLGIPFYTRYWWTQAGAVYSEVVYQSHQDEILSENHAETYWNNELCQTVASWEKDGLPYQMWVEDEASIGYKVDLVKKYGLAGVAGWRLGLEKPGIWQTIAEHLAG